MLFRDTKFDLVNLTIFPICQLFIKPNIFNDIFRSIIEYFTKVTKFGYYELGIYDNKFPYKMQF